MNNNNKHRRDYSSRSNRSINSSQREGSSFSLNLDWSTHSSSTSKTSSSIKTNNNLPSPNVDALCKAIIVLPPNVPAIQALDGHVAQLDGRAVAAIMKDLYRAGQGHRASDLFDCIRATIVDTGNGSYASAASPFSTSSSSLSSDGIIEMNNLQHHQYNLADLYTYTTAISQCNGRHQLKRALELMAEMRSRGLKANVHTYSALMSVCVKSGECDLALDVYQQLLKEGLSPNAVTANILIDVHGKSGRWEAAIGVLEDLRGTGVEPEARTFNAVIAACARYGQADAAASVYHIMLSDGVKPTDTTFTSLISAFGRVGRADEALSVFKQMPRYRCEPNVITYSSLLSACERAGRVQLVFELFGEMTKKGCRPNVVTYNALLGACAQTGDWQLAERLMGSMKNTDGCRPDAATHSAVIATYQRGGQWRGALSAFENMVQSGFRPDATVYCSVVESLWGSGLLAGHLKAVQLFTAAKRQGIMKPGGCNGVGVGPFVDVPGAVVCIAHTYAAAFLSVLSWLADIKVNNLHHQCRNNNKNNKNNNNNRLLLHLIAGRHRGHHHPSDPPLFPTLQSNLESVLCATFGAPITIQQAEDGLVVQLTDSSRTGIVEWLESSEVEDLLSLLSFNHSDTAASTNTINSDDNNNNNNAMVTEPLHLSTNTILTEDGSAASRCGEAFAAVGRVESIRSSSSSSNMESAVHAMVRQKLLSSLVTINSACGGAEVTLHDAVHLCDRFLNAIEITTDTILRQLDAEALAFSSALILLSCQQAVNNQLTILDVSQLTGVAVSSISNAQQCVSLVLRDNISAISSLRILQLYLERCQAGLYSSSSSSSSQSSSPTFSSPPPSPSSLSVSPTSASPTRDGDQNQQQEEAGLTLMSRIELTATNLVVQVTCSGILSSHPSSVVAAACLAEARRRAGLLPAWPIIMQELTGYELVQGSELSSCLGDLIEL